MFIAGLMRKVWLGSLVGVVLAGAVTVGWGAEGGGAAVQQVPTVGLLEAAKTGNLAMVKLHMAVGNKIDLVGEDGMTALEYAARNDDLAMYQVLMETKLFKPTTNLKFLAAHGLANVDEILKKQVPEALQLVKVEGEDVKRVEKPAVGPVDERKAMARVKELAGQVSGLSEGEKEKLLSRVEELWKLPKARVVRRGAMGGANEGAMMGGQGMELQRVDTRQADMLIMAAQLSSPAVKEYLLEYRENAFMMDLLKTAARIAVEMEGEKK